MVKKYSQSKEYQNKIDQEYKKKINKIIISYNYRK